MKVTFTQELTWSITGSSAKGTIVWDATTNTIDAKDAEGKSYYITFLTETTIEVVKAETGGKYTFTKEVAEEKSEEGSTSSGSGKKDYHDGLYAIMDLGATVKMESEWSENWNKARLDSNTGFYNSEKSASQKKDYWIEIEMKKPSEVHQIILSKFHFEHKDDAKYKP